MTQDNSFSPPHQFPLELRPISLYEHIPVNKAYPYTAAFLGLLGSTFNLTSGADISQTMAVAFPAITLGSAAVIYGLHRAWLWADRKIAGIYHTIQITEKELIVTSHDADNPDGNDPRKRHVFSLNGLEAWVTESKDGIASYLCIGDMLIVTPLTHQEAREAKMMINNALQYACARYDLRDDMKAEAEKNFLLAFPARALEAATAQAQAQDPAPPPA
ncbi:MAG TPA: hypothetical protein PLO23_03280 [Alphaproteobacteria bacterium]|nr:hypothetical protein [Alphaproteobacteria bacterium]